MTPTLTEADLRAASADDGARVPTRIYAVAMSGVPETRVVDTIAHFMEGIGVHVQGAA